MERKSCKMSRMNALWILGIALVGTFSVLIIFDVDIDLEIETIEIEDRIIEINYIPEMKSIREDSIEIFDGSTYNLELFDEFYEKTVFMKCYEIDQDILESTIDESAILTNGTAKIFYSDSDIGYFFIFRTPEEFTLNYKFYVNILGLDKRIYDFNETLDRILEIAI